MASVLHKSDPAAAMAFPYERCPLSRQELWFWMMTHLFDWVLYWLVVIVTLSLQLVRQILKFIAWMFWYGQEVCKEHNCTEAAAWFNLHLQITAWYCRQLSLSHNWLCKVYAHYLGVV